MCGGGRVDTVVVCVCVGRRGEEEGEGRWERVGERGRERGGKRGERGAGGRGDGGWRKYNELRQFKSHRELHGNMYIVDCSDLKSSI